MRTRTNFLIDSTQGFAFDDKIWENVCPFEGFKERCSTDYQNTAAYALGFRHDLVRSGFTFVGADYTAGPGAFLGESGWGVGMDANLKRLGAVLALSLLSTAAAACTGWGRLASAWPSPASSGG